MTKRKNEFCSSVTYSLPIKLIQKFDDYMAQPAVRKAKITKSKIIESLLKEFLEEGSLQGLLKRSGLYAEEQDHGTGKAGDDRKPNPIAVTAGSSGPGKSSQGNDAPAKEVLGGNDNVLPPRL